jgi:hypothetical protein
MLDARHCERSEAISTRSFRAQPRNLSNTVIPAEPVLPALRLVRRSPDAVYQDEVGSPSRWTKDG